MLENQYSYGRGNEQKGNGGDVPSFCQSSLFLCTGAVAYPNARFGMGMGPIYLNNLACNGGEMSILDCMNDGLGVFGACTHADDAAVMCQECKPSIIG